MIELTYSCKTCNSENIIKNGKNRAGSQTYKCKDCSNYGVLDSVKRTAQILYYLSNSFSKKLYMLHLQFKY